jgi:iron complex transport system permease protein
VLAAVGTVFQMVFRNPLVDSHFLGVTGGAAFGAALAIVMLGGRPETIQLSAALFALAGLTASYTIARRIRMGGWVLRLLLAGIVVSAFFRAGIGMLKYLADPQKQLPEITFWLLGGLWSLTPRDSLHIFAVGLPCVTVIHLMRWRLNLLSMQDEIAFSLTSSPDRERLVLLLAAVLATAAVVSKTGQIGWVGLIVPHMARRIVGSDAQRVLPWSMALGGLFMLLCDDVSRTVLSGEIPIGILTSFGGAAFFSALLMSHNLVLKGK